MYRYNICSIRTSWIILVPRLRENGIGIVNETHWIDSDLKKHGYVLLKAQPLAFRSSKLQGFFELGWAWIIPCSRIIYMTMPETQKKPTWRMKPSRMHKGDLILCPTAVSNARSPSGLSKILGGPSCFHGTMAPLFAPGPCRIPSCWYGPPKRKTIIHCIGCIDATLNQGLWEMFNITRKGSWVCEASRSANGLNGEELATLQDLQGRLVSSTGPRLLKNSWCDISPSPSCSCWKLNSSINYLRTSWSTRVCKTCHLLRMFEAKPMGLHI